MEAASEFHIRLENKIESARDIDHLKDILFDATGSCSVYFHIDTENGEYIVQANDMMKAPPAEEFANRIRDLPLVSDVWIS